MGVLCAVDAALFSGKVPRNIARTTVTDVWQLTPLTPVVLLPELVEAQYEESFRVRLKNARQGQYWGRKLSIV